MEMKQARAVPFAVMAMFLAAFSCSQAAAGGDAPSAAGRADIVDVATGAAQLDTPAAVPDAADLVVDPVILPN